MPRAVTQDNTSGFTQGELDGINELHADLMTEYDGDDEAQFSKSIDDAITNSWCADQTWEELEASVRKKVGL